MSDVTPKLTEVRSDGPYENVFLNVGTRGDRSAFTRAFSRQVLTNLELDTLYESDGFARRIIDLPAREMVRAGYQIEAIDNDGDIRAALEAINAMPLVAKALRWADLYGGAMIVMLVNDGNLLEEPLNETTIRNLESLRVYDRHQVTRFTKYEDPADKRYGQVETYLVSPMTGSPYMVHSSRCILVDGVDVPDRIRERNDGWGNSKLQQCYEQLVRFGMGHMWANALLERAQQAVHGVPNLTDLLRSPEGEALVRKRLTLVDMARSVNNTVAIDATETYDLKATSLTGVSDLLDRFGTALSSVSGIPEGLLFGRQQAGLNSTGRGELENWYGQVGQLQTDKLLPILDRLVTIQLHASGKYKKDYLIKFNPLFVPSDKELAEVDKLRAETYQLYHSMQVLDSSEIRDMVRDEGYDIDEVKTLGETGGEDLEDGQDEQEGVRQP